MEENYESVQFTESPKRKYTYEELLDKYGSKFSSFQRLLIVFCGLAWLLDGVELSAEGFLYPRFEKAFGLSTLQLGILSCVKNFSAACGAFLFGLLAEMFGTRRMFQISFTIVAAFGAASALAETFWQLVLLRSLTGFGTGANLILAITYLREFFPKSVRETVIVLMHVWMGMGMFTVNIMDWYFGDNWRTFLIVAISPACVAFLFFCWGVEKPQYLLAHGHYETVQGLLLTLGVPRDKVMLMEHSEESEEHNYLEELLSENRSTLFYHSCMWFGISYGSMAQIWIPVIYTDLFEVPTDAFHTLMFVIMVCTLFAVFWTAWVIREDGGIKPENFLFYALLIVCLTFSILAAILFLHWNVEQFMVGHFLLSIPMGTMWSVVYAVTPRFFEAHVRSAALGVCGAFKYGGSIVAPLLGGYIMKVQDIESGYCTYIIGFLIAVFGSYHMVVMDENLISMKERLLSPSKTVSSD